MANAKLPFNDWPTFNPGSDEYSYSPDHTFRVIPWGMEAARRAIPHLGDQYMTAAGSWYGVTVTPYSRLSLGERGALIRVAVPDTLDSGQEIDRACLWIAMASARAWIKDNKETASPSDVAALRQFTRDPFSVYGTTGCTMGQGFFSSAETRRAIVRAVADSDQGSL